MRVLLINPNTSIHITERLAASARDALEDGEELTAVTATNGPAVVRDAATLGDAQAGALEVAARHLPGHDAVVLGISLDGAAPTLRARHPELPIIGMTEAALLTACLRSERLGLLTLGPSMLPLYRERVEQIGIASRVVACEAPEMPAAFGAGRDRVDADVLEVLAEACTRLRAGGAESITLAGAVLCGYAPALAARCGLPVFDGVACAIAQLRVQIALRRLGPMPGSGSPRC